MQLFRAIIAVCLLLAVAGVAAQPNSPDQPVGKVLLVSGEAYADQQRLQVDSPIYIGQTLKTAVGSHLHIRMIDGAFLSLRQRSAARIALYTVDLEQPTNNQIRIDIQQGVVRSVSGKGAESNRAGFRVNTPVAAIGIRGTDFVVYTDALSSVVDLLRGSIEMTPLSDACSPYTLGACSTNASVTLAERHADLVAEVHAASQQAAKVNKANATVLPERVAPAHPAETQSLQQAKQEPVVISKTMPPTASSATVASTEKTTAEVATETPAQPASKSNLESQSTALGTNNSTSAVKAPSSNALAGTALVSSGTTAGIATLAPVTAEVGAKDSVTAEIASRVITQATTQQSVKQLDKTLQAQSAGATTTAVTPPAAAKTQPFYWGRWANYAESPEQNIARDPARNRQIFTANSAMLLASTESGTPSLPNTGVVNFRVDGAEAHIMRGESLREASVSNPALAIDFGTNRFNTRLDVNSSYLPNGTERLYASGTLDKQTGTLRNSLLDSNMSVSGRVADGASHAAYLFNQDNTGIVGAVRWAAE